MLLRSGEYDDWDIYSASEHSSEELKSAEQEYLDAYAPEEIMAALAKLSPERRRVRKQLNWPATILSSSNQLLLISKKVLGHS